MPDETMYSCIPAPSRPREVSGGKGIESGIVFPEGIGYYFRVVEFIPCFGRDPWDVRPQALFPQGIGQELATLVPRVRKMFACSM